jgi:hypothetical protein
MNIDILYDNFYKLMNEFELNENPQYLLLIILISLIIIYFFLGKLFTYIGFIVSMYYMYKYWKNRENVNKNIKKLLKEYKNLFKFE